VQNSISPDKESRLSILETRFISFPVKIPELMPTIERMRREARENDLSGKVKSHKLRDVFNSNK
jgi:hypothetical protein